MTSYSMTIPNRHFADRVADAIDKDHGTAVVKLLRENGVKAHHPLWGKRSSPFGRAISLNKRNTVVALLQADPFLASANPLDGKGTALQVACMARCAPAVEALLNLGADPNEWTPSATSYPPLAIACRGDNVFGIVDLLLLAGADPHVRVAMKGNPACPLLHACCLWGQHGVLGVLIQRGIDIETRDTQGRTCLHVAAEIGSPECVRLLLKNGADLNAQDSQGWSPLHRAVIYNDSTRMAALLIQGGANVKLMDNHGMMALHLFWMEGRHIKADGGRKIIDLLLSHGAEIEAKDEHGKTALLWACRQANPSLVETFAAVGADIHAKDNTGRTALHYACADWTPGHRVGVGPLPFCQALLRLGANPVVTDDEGNLPFFSLSQSVYYRTQSEYTESICGSILVLLEAALNHGLILPSSGN